MELIGTNFSITLGAWRVRFSFAVEDTDAPQAPRATPPHRMRVVPHEQYQRREG